MSLFSLGPDFSDDVLQDFCPENDFPGNAFLEEIIRSVRHGAREMQRVHVILEAAGIGLWQQKSNMLCLSGGWHRIFDVPVGGIFLLENYVALINNPEDRVRVGESRDALHQKPENTLWEDTFSLAGRMIRSVAIVTGCGTVLGADILV